MAEKNPFEELMEQLADLLVTLNENQGKILDDKEMPTDIDKQLEELENDINLFVKITDEALKKSGVTEDELIRKIGDPSELRNRRDKRLVERAAILKAELQQMERNLSGYVRGIKMGKKKFGKKGRKRKSKFKRLGGDDKGWMPL